MPRWLASPGQEHEHHAPSSSLVQGSEHGHHSMAEPMQHGHHSAAEAMQHGGMDAIFFPLFLCLLTLALAWWYLRAARRHSESGGAAIARSQRICFFGGLALYLAASLGPAATWSHHSFSIHMTQMGVHYFIVPALLYIGLSWHPFASFGTSALGRLVRRTLLNPFVVLLVFNGLISLYHLPVVFDTIMSSPLWHHLSHAILMIAALAVAWTLLGPLGTQGLKVAGGSPLPTVGLREPGRIPPALGRFGLLVANSILLLPVCALIFSSDQILYQSYATDPSTWPYFSALADQRIGGVMMKLIQEFTYIGVLRSLFYRWVRESRLREQAEEAECG